MENTSRFNFSEWPLDLLVDYVLKVHHRRVREKGPGTLSLINKLKFPTCHFTGFRE